MNLIRNGSVAALVLALLSSCGDVATGGRPATIAGPLTDDTPTDTEGAEALTEARREFDYLQAVETGCCDQP